MQDELFIEQIESYSAKEEWSNVVAACTQAIEAGTIGEKVYPFLAKAYARQGKLNEAIATYHQILDAEVEEAEIHGELGLLYSRKHQLQEAVRHYQEGLALKPDWTQLQFNLAVVFHQLENWQMAVAAYQKTIELDPNYAPAYFNLGLVYQRQHNLAAAAENYRQAISLQPDRVRNYSNLGKVLFQQQRVAEAIAAFEAGLKLDPTDASLHEALGLTYWWDGQLELAISSFEYAIAVAPEMAVAHHNLGKLWQQQGDYPAAIACFRKVIELEPQNVSAYSHCAHALQQVGRLQEAIDCWHRVVTLKPTAIDAYIRQGIALQPRDLPTMAKSSCARFLAVLQQKSNYTEIYHYLWQTYWHLGDIWFERGEIERATMYYQQALEIKTDKPELYLRLGNCLTRQERLDAAIAIYRAGSLFEGDRRELSVQLSKVIRQKSSLQLFPVDQSLAWLPQTVYYHTQDWVRDSQLDNFDYATIDWEDTSSQARIMGKREPEPISSFDSQEYRERGTPKQRADWLVSGLDTSSVASEEQLVSNTDPLPNVELTDFPKPSFAVSKETPRTTKLPPKSLFPQITSTYGYDGDSYRNELVSYFTAKQLDRNAYQCCFARSVPINPLTPFVVTIPNGRIWIAPQKSSWQICHALAVITPDGYLLKDLSYHYRWFLPISPNETSNIRHALFRLEEIPPAAKIKGRVAILSGLAGHTYERWMLDILPRVELIRRGGIELNSIDWFVVNNINRPFQKETLALLKIPPTKTLSSDRYSHITATELIVASLPGYLDWISSGTIEFLRATFLAQSSLSPEQYAARIYLSSARASERRVINESEVVELLERYGFQTVFLEEMPVVEQVGLFAKAEIIVAPHGSGMANLAFCKPNTTIIELFSPNYVRTDYWAISRQLRLQHYYLIGDRFDCDHLRYLMYQSSGAEDILVELKSLELILNTVQNQ